MYSVFISYTFQQLWCNRPPLIVIDWNVFHLFMHVYTGFSWLIVVYRIYFVFLDSFLTRYFRGLQDSLSVTQSILECFLLPVWLGLNVNVTNACFCDLRNWPLDSVPRFFVIWPVVPPDLTAWLWSGTFLSWFLCCFFVWVLSDVFTCRTSTIMNRSLWSRSNRDCDLQLVSTGLTVHRDLHLFCFQFLYTVAF